MMRFAFAVSFLSLVAGRELTSTSPEGRTLLSQSRALEENAYDYVGGYALKFQGCHHVQQWNTDADGEDDVRIFTKRLGRYRLCPLGSCSSDKSSGCTTKYGDYIVDLGTLVGALTQIQGGDACNTADEACQNQCNGAEDDCMEKCYENTGSAYCLEEDEANANGFDVQEYLECKQVDLNNNGGGRRLEQNQEDVAYYVGPYCANQGGEVRLGVFTDDACSVFADYGDDLFQSTYGYELPYSQTSLVTNKCIGCGVDYGNGQTQSNAICDDMYASSGKCETKMEVDYRNEASCSYIEGIKIIREDGVIRTNVVRKSKPAAVAIGLFLTLSVLLAAYVYYLRTKLQRAQINLAAAAHSG